MKIYLYNQPRINRRYTVRGGVEYLKTYLQPYLIATIENNQTMARSETFIDVEYSALNVTANYVIIEEEVETLAYFVNDKKAISVGVLRLYLTLDTLSTYFTSNINFVNGYFKRSNATALLNSSRTLTYTEINSPVEYTTAEGMGLFDNGSIFGLCAQVVYTSGQSRIGDHVYLLSKEMQRSSLTGALQEIGQIKSVTRGTKKGDVKVEHIFIIPKIFYPEETFAEDVEIELASGDPIIYFTNVKEYYRGLGGKSITGYLDVRPELKFKIGGWIGNIILENYNIIGELPIIYNFYGDPLELRLTILIDNVEYDITTAIETTILNSTQAIENSQKKANGVIANILTLMGQGATTIGALSTGNYLAGVLGLGQIGTQTQNISTFAKQKISGGVDEVINAGQYNVAKGLLLCVQVGSSKSGSLLKELNARGYEMFESYNPDDLEVNKYYEIVADEVEGVPLKYEQDFLTRLSNGIYLLSV